MTPLLKDPPLNALQLRPTTPADAEFLRNLFRSTRAALLENLPGDAAQKNALCEMQQRAQAMGYQAAYPDAEYRVICSGDVAVGRMVKAWSEQGLVLVDIALLPAFRGRGLGTALLRCLQVEAAAMGKPLLLAVEKSNPAQSLYLRLGLVVVGEDDFRLQMMWEAV